MADTKKQLDKIEARLVGKLNREKATLKGIEVGKVGHRPRRQRKDFDIEIVDTNAIEGGVEAFIRAWENGQQIAFGKDGSVEIERIRIFNPPILVDDENGDIVREYPYTDPDTKVTKVTVKKYREAPEEALMQVIEHTVKVMQFKRLDTSRMVKGKRGNTTSTFYPNAGTGTAPVDGEALRSVAGEAWSTLRGGNGNGSSVSANSMRVSLRAWSTTNNWNQILRVLMGFDTSSIPDGDTINSATISVWKDNTLGVGSTCSLTESFNFTNASFGDVTTIADSDYQLQTGNSTVYSTAKACSDVINGQYNDWALNTDGKNHISKTGISYFALKPTGDITNTEPSWSSSSIADFTMYSADETGTSKDPKLVVEHTTPLIEATYTENATLNESILKETTRPILEAIGLNDSIVRSISRTISEAMTAVGTFLGEKVIPVLLTEAIALNDAITRQITALRTEAMALNDTLITAWTKVVTFIENIGLNDIFSRVLTLSITFTENIGLNDTIRKLLNGSAVIWQRVARNVSSWRRIDRDNP